MSEILEIQNFGPLRNVKVELKRFNIIIGENATGKSSIAKVLSICRTFRYIYQGSLVSSESVFLDGLDAWGLREYLTNETRVFYSCEHYHLSVSYRPVSRYYPIPDSEEFVERNEPVFLAEITPKSETFGTFLKESEVILKEKGDLFLRIWDQKMNDVLGTPFYLPTERGLQSLFSLGRRSIQNVTDSLFMQLANLDAIAKSFSSEIEIEPLNVQYLLKDGRAYIRKNAGDKFVSLFNAASGYQSMIPIILVVKRYTENKKGRQTIVIEEPELNLYPDAQYKLMQYLVHRCINESECSMLMTTHSPYVLNTINALMYAYWIGLFKKERVSSIVEEAFWLNPDEVTAYKLSQDGTLLSIFDDSTKQIDVKELDSISDLITSKWNSIKELDDIF